MRQIMPEDALPDAETVRDHIDRERDERADFKRQLALLRLQKRRRDMGA
jgi:hypothetical protein